MKVLFTQRCHDIALLEPNPFYLSTFSCTTHSILLKYAQEVTMSFSLISTRSIVMLLGFLVILTTFTDAEGKPLPSVSPFLQAFGNMVRLEPRMTGGCQQYGHSCLGGHGKRAYEGHQQRLALQNWLHQMMRARNVQSADAFPPPIAPRSDDNLDLFGILMTNELEGNHK